MITSRASGVYVLLLWEFTHYMSATDEFNETNINVLEYV
jgi:hypothetical protein